jgi:hypothetical protein
MSKSEASPRTPHAAVLHDLLERIVKVRHGDVIGSPFQSLNAKVNEMERLAAEAIRILEDAPESETRGSDETGWLIENAERLYLTTDATGFFAWTKDNLDAIRFCRRQDAEKVASGNDDAWHVVEHMWSDPAPIEKMNVNTEKRGKP